jgi:hypothetical protein
MDPADSWPTSPETSGSALLAALRELEELGCELTVTPDGRPRVTGSRQPPPHVQLVLRENRELLVAVALGRAGKADSGGPAHPTTAHDLAPCTECGQARMVGVTTGRLKSKSPWPACGMTPGCTGRHVPTDVGRWKSSARQQPTTRGNHDH